MTAARAGRCVSKDSRLGLDVRVHPTNADVVFVGNIAAYRSDDGGKTWTSIKGAPGGDDYQRIWINPLQPDIMLFTADQGAVVTVNGGRTWSSWYNQPTAQMYHVTTDNQFPYWVYGGQQESGAIGIASRGNGGQISFRDWIGVGADEYAYIAPDPQDANIIYGGRVMRFDRRTGQAQNVAPEALRSGKYRILRTMPLLFHPADPKTLFFATNVLWKTTTGGHSWDDHQPGPFARAAGRAREHRRLPHAGDEDDAAARGHLRGEPVTTRRQRHLGRNRRWARARDAGRRKDVDERDAAGAARLGQGVADRRRPFRHEHRLHRDQCDPPRRHASAHLSHPRWRPHLDAHRQRHQSRSGRSTSCAKIRSSAGLLFAGTEREVVFSADDGERWQSLRMNMPAVVRPRPGDQGRRPGGRDARTVDLDPRQHRATAADRRGGARERGVPVHAGARHARAVEHVLGYAAAAGGTDRARTRRTARSSTTTCRATSKNVTLEIVGADGEVIRRYSSADEPERIDPTTLPYPTYWIRPHQPLRDDRGASPVRVGPALRAAARGAAHACHRGRPPEDAEWTRRTVRPPGFVYGAPDRGWCGTAAARSRCGSIRA